MIYVTDISIVTLAKSSLMMVCVNRNMLEQLLNFKWF